MMKAISLWEPWATAMALNLKRNETRSWSTNYRGDLAICAAKRPMTGDERYIWDEFIQPCFPNELVQYGCVLCIVNVIDCLKTESIIEKVSAAEYDLGNYESGRFAWVTDNCRRLIKPVPIKGTQGFFNLPPDIEQQVRNQI